MRGVLIQKTVLTMEDMEKHEGVEPSPLLNELHELHGGNGNFLIRKAGKRGSVKNRERVTTPATSVLSL